HPQQAAHGGVVVDDQNSRLSHFLLLRRTQANRAPLPNSEAVADPRLAFALEVSDTTPAPPCDVLRHPCRAFRESIFSAPTVGFRQLEGEQYPRVLVLR